TASAPGRRAWPRPRAAATRRSPTPAPTRPARRSRRPASRRPRPPRWGSARRARSTRRARRPWPRRTSRARRARSGWPSRWPCGCGNHGCLEAYAGRAQMEARARHEVEEGHKTVLFEIQKKKGRPHLTSGVWLDALNQGDELAERLIERAILALAAGIGSVQN